LTLTPLQRRLWWAAGLLVALVGGPTLAYVIATDSDRGRAWLLGVVQDQATKIFGGRASLRVGVLRSIGLTSISALDVSLLDTAGVAVVHADSVDATIDLAGILFSKAIHIRLGALRGVKLDLRQDARGPWNIAHIISGDTTPALPNAKPGYGNNIRIDALTLDRVAITTIAPWAPNVLFTGTSRDSVIVARDSLHDIVHTSVGLFERRTIALTRVVSHDAIISQPSHAPSSMQIDSLMGTISDPPITLVHAAGEIRWTGDSLMLNLPAVALPASTGSAIGSISWHDKGPLRYDVLVKAKAGLSDLRWIWDVLPTTGGGTATIRMHTLADANNAEYQLTDLDVRSMDSHITGQISVTTRVKDLLLHHVDLAFAPMQSDLMRRLSYGVVPDTVRGTIDGKLVALAGGPLRAFVIDTLRARFVDARITGALSSIDLSGTVGLGANPTGHNLDIRSLIADLRTARTLAKAPSPMLASLDGVLSASGRIADASLTNVAAKQLSLIWTDGVGNRSIIRGDATLGFGPRNALIETALQIDALSMRALARIDTTLGVRADLTGSLRTSGTLEALGWTATIGAMGDGAVDLRGTASLIDNTWRVAAAGAVTALNARLWTMQNATPATSVDGTLQVSAVGTRGKDGTTVLEQGGAMVNLRQAASDERPAFDLVASTRLDAQRLTVDSATAHLGGVTFGAHGTLGRREGAVDTLQVSASADSLEQVQGQLQRLAAMIAPMDSGMAKTLRAYAADTLRGDVSISGFLVGAIPDFGATLAIGGSRLQVGAIHLERIFGSLHADNVRTAPTFAGAATADGVDGLGAIRIASAEFKVLNASPDSGKLVLEVSSRDAAHLVLRGGFLRAAGVTDVALDSLRFQYDSTTWQNFQPVHVRADSRGIRVDSLELRSTAKGVFGMSANVPVDGAITALMRFERFPVGEATTFAMGTQPFDGTLTGTALLTGTRDAPLINWTLRADSLGINGTYLPMLSSDGAYADKRIVARVRIVDSLGGSLHAEARVPIDLSLHAVDKRVLSDAVDAEIVADSLRLQSLGLVVDGVSNQRGIVAGRLALTGTMDRPVATGTMTVEQFGASVPTLGINPSEGRVVLRAAQDSLVLESLRFRSGGSADTVFATGAMRFAAKEPATVHAQLASNNVQLAHQRDGTDLNVTGNVVIDGALKRPAMSGRLFIPTANLVIDPLGASKALDLNSAGARELLGVDEVPVAATAAQSLSKLGRFVTVNNARVDLGSEVWVQTPEAKVKVAGGLNVTMSGEKLALEGEIVANRGQYRLDLGVVNRSFAVDSGVVRFYGSDAISPTLDISATNVVRVSTGGEIPVRVHIGGSLDRPVVTLSSSDPLFASAPESEIISLLIFGAPTFALDGQSQSTVKAVTGVLLPSVGGAVEGALQRLLPVFNTVQVNTAGGQTKDDLSAYSLLDNLSITAGKQIGEKAFLRVNTGVCRSTGQSASLWYGIAAEYRLSRGLSAQVGVDPGSAPCTRLGVDPLPKMQFGFDLFREWIF